MKSQQLIGKEFIFEDIEINGVPSIYNATFFQYISLAFLKLGHAECAPESLAHKIIDA